MSLVDRINRAVAARVHRDRPRLTVEGDAVRIEQAGVAPKLLALATLTRATVLHRDVYAGDAILLALRFADGTAAELFSDDPQWPALAEALDRSGRIATPSADWQVQAVADGPGAPARELI